MKFLESIAFAAACFYLYGLVRFVVSNWTHIVGVLPMKFFWFNDTDKTQALYGPTLANYLGIIDPKHGREVEVDLRDHEVPFIKIWETGAVLISGITGAALLSTDPTTKPSNS